MEYYLSPPVIVGALFAGLCVTFFYIYGEKERSNGWKWAVPSFFIWVFLALICRLGLILQLIGQLIFFASITWYNMNHPPEANITK
jgi:hypothetical protein